MDRETISFYKSIFDQHWGLCSQLARELEMNPCSIANWFRGMYRSPRLEAAVPEFLQRQGLPYEVVRQEIDPLEAIL